MAHPKGSPITAKEKICILNLYQSYVNEKMSVTDAKAETAKRLGYGENSVANAIKGGLISRDVFHLLKKDQENHYTQPNSSLCT